LEINSSRFLRNKDLIDQKNLKGKVTLIGAGGIGSALIQLLAIMGWKDVMVWDDDVLAPHNLSTTTYQPKYLGKDKSLVAMETFNSFSDKSQKINHKPFRWYSDSKISPRVFLGPDNMDTRKEVYEKWASLSNREFLIDMRMGALGMEIITATKESDNYMDTWMDGNSIKDEACTMKHTIFTANIVAGFGINQAFCVLQGIPYYSYINISLTPLICRKEGFTVSRTL
tara:strand:+ start:3094 stop:3774 length:681 start_codon:yes stop_codon:yes gene_type:complete